MPSTARPTRIGPPAGSGANLYAAVEPADLDVAIDRALREPGRLLALAASGLVDSAPEEAFDRLARLAARALSAPIALISLVDDRRQFFKAAVNLPSPWADRRETPLSHSFCKHVVASNEPLVVRDAASDPRVRGNRAIDDLGVAAYAGVPIRTSDGHVLGSLCVIDDRPREWPADAVDLLGDIANLVMTEVGVRAATAEAHQTQTRFEATLKALLGVQELSSALAGASSESQALDVVMIDAMHILEADSCAVAFVHDDGTMRLVATHGASDDVDQRVAMLPRDRSNPVVDALERRELLLFEDRATMIGQYPALRDVADPNFEATAITPVVSAADDPICSLAFGWRGRRDFPDADRLFLVVLASVVAAALERVHRDAGEREAAVRLQRGLLPKELPAVDRIDLAVTYLPANNDLLLGGDWYDVIDIDERRTLLCVGDVVGHETGAAVTMAKLRSMMRALALVNPDPVSVVTRLSKAAWTERVMATVAVALVDLEALTLTYVSAGHPPLLLRRGREVQSLDATGLMCGAAPRAAYSSTVTPIAHGDIVLGYTDGLVERRGEIIDDGIRRLGRKLGVVPPRAGPALDEVVHEMLGDVAERVDDVAALLARVDLYGDERV